MKTAGSFFSSIIDEQFMDKAQDSCDLHNSWVSIVTKNGISSAAEHSQVKNLNKGILYIETDHPGWKQIIQTKQSHLLEDFCSRFPKLEITGIAIILVSHINSITDTLDSNIQNKKSTLPEPKTVETNLTQITVDESLDNIYNLFDDKELREKLISLDKYFTDRDKRRELKNQ